MPEDPRAPLQVVPDRRDAGIAVIDELPTDYEELDWEVTRSDARNPAHRMATCTQVVDSNRPSGTAPGEIGEDG
jgi:hypothetical protein